jgi:hypothetical protein
MKYIVSVTRIGYGGLDLEVEADSEDKAKEIALNQATGHAFSEHHSDYQVDQVVESRSFPQRSSLALHLLDDDYGISEDAYNALMEAGMVSDDIANNVKATEGRFYLPSVSRDQLAVDFHE